MRHPPVSNLTGMTPTQCSSGGNLNVSTDGYNHLVSTGYGYDNAGNMTSDAAYTYAYDAENRITSANGVNYTYDGNGLRVEKSSGTLYWRSIWGDALAESDLQGNITNEYVFFAGRRIARISSSTVNYFYSDVLGTTHTITDATGRPCYDASFTPYGQEVLNPNISQTCSSNYKFTGYEYDSETGLYYAFARYYNLKLGRFMSADPLGGDPRDPQSLNGYPYVLNDPGNLIDPAGLCDVVVGGIGQAPGTPQTAEQDNYASKSGSESVYPYNQPWYEGFGLPRLMFGSADANDVKRALLSAAKQPGLINIVTCSGGAEGTSSAIKQLPTSIQARIGNVTYLSPGTNGATDLFVSQSGETRAFFGNDGLDYMATFGTAVPVGVPQSFLNCGHSANCEFKAAAAYLNAHKGTPCPKDSNSSGGGCTGASVNDGFGNFLWLLDMGYWTCTATWWENGKLVSSGPCASGGSVK